MSTLHSVLVVVVVTEVVVVIENYIHEFYFLYKWVLKKYIILILFY